MTQMTQTWVELQMVKSQANTVVLRSMVRIPNTQVSPSRGRRMIVAFKVDLLTKRCLTGRSYKRMSFVVGIQIKLQCVHVPKVTPIIVLSSISKHYPSRFMYTDAHS